MYAAVKKFAVRGFIVANIFVIAFAMLLAMNVIPKEIPTIDWIKVDNPEVLMWVLFSPILLIYGLFVLVMGFELSKRIAYPAGTFMVGVMGYRSGMLLVYLPIWITIGWWMWKIPGSDLLYNMISGLMSNTFQEGSLASEVLDALVGYLGIVDMILYVFSVLFPIAGCWITLGYMALCRKAHGGNFHDVVDDPNFEVL